jgi:hypothetical protein
MRRQWRLRRQTRSAADGQRRWNQASHFLLEWGTPPAEGSSTRAAGEASPPPGGRVAANQPVAAEQEEVPARGVVGARLDPATGSAPVQ